MSPEGESPEHDPGACTACRGTGTVTSGKGGEPHPVQCPWCEGTGRFIPEHNAQEAGMARRAADGESATPAEPAPAVE